MGLSERDAVTATLYNSNIIISPEGEIVSCHRKLKPTGAERLVWGDANKGYFPMADTPWGPVGCLICWESYMYISLSCLVPRPDVRFLFEQYLEVGVSSFLIKIFIRNESERCAVDAVSEAAAFRRTVREHMKSDIRAQSSICIPAGHG